MPRSGVLVLAGLASLACRDTPTEVGPTPDPVRTVVFRLADAPGLYAIRADGTGETRLAVPTALDTMVLIGMSRGGGRLAFLGPDGIYTYRPADTTSLTRVLDRPSGDILPAALSDDDRFLALITFPGNDRPTMIVVDLTSGLVDTLPTAVTVPAMPPAFSPDNQRLAVVGVNSFTLEVALVERETGITFATNPVRGSRHVDRPIFGWPRWTAQGLHLAVRRQPLNGAVGPDTIIAVTLDPGDPDRGYRRRFYALSDLNFGPAGTFAYSSDGNALVYGARRVDGTTMGIFFQSANTPEVQLVRDDPAATEIFPQMVNGTLPVPLR